MKRFSSKRRMAAAVAVILLLLFLLRPGASRLKSRIAGSISAAVNRPVEIGSVRIRLLPRPGFDLENLVVYDDPAFGAEPMLRAAEVTAVLRLTSLVRGRLEIARLDLTEPSLNLVYRENGRWNLEALLERTAHVPLAPTAKAKLEPRPGFPYIEATSARINFKAGQEKKPYALTNADFALWQDSENAWGVRLKAQPFRTDLNLNDTGILRMDGTWQRAASLRDTPLQFSVEWDRPQLGQLTKFLTGSDKGWRGGVQLDATLTGTPTKLQIASAASIQDFRRYDIPTGEPLRLAGHCDGQYSSLDHGFHGLVCNSPVANGRLTLKGDIGLSRTYPYAVVLTAENLPARAVVELARRAKKNLPEDLVAAGTISGSLSMQSNNTPSKSEFAGRGEVSGFRLSSVTSKAEIGPETVPFVFVAGDSRRSTSSKTFRARLLNEPRMEFGPFVVATGHAAAPTARGWISRAGYKIALAGDLEAARALRVAAMFGLPGPNTTTEGLAQLDLQIAGSWPGWSYGTSTFYGPQVTGTAKLHNVRVEVREVGGPIEISSAELQLSSDRVRVAKLSASAANATWTGSLELPRGCGTPAACLVHFNLSTNEVGFTELSEWVSPPPKERPWYRVLGSSAPAGASFLAKVRASGHVNVNRFSMRALTATHVAANLTLDGGKVLISELTADLLGGKHRGEWQVDFSGKPAVYKGSGSLDGISLEQLAGTMKDGWITGTARGTYQVSVSGLSSGDFWQLAEGTLEFDLRDGSLSHVSLGEEAGSLRVARFSGQAKLHAGKLEIKDAWLDSPGEKFEVSGTASLKRDLDLKLAGTPTGATPRGYAITGTVAEPRVARLTGPETQARLKP